MHGFTLIEVVLYTALLALLLTSAIGIAYSSLDAATHTTGRADAENDRRFLTEKIDWALNQSDEIETPIQGTSTELKLHTQDPALEPLLFSYDSADSKITMSVGGANPEPITSDTIPVTAFATYTTTVPGITETELEIHTRIGGEDMTLIRYLP